MQSVYAALSEHLSDRRVAPAQWQTVRRQYAAQWRQLAEIVSLAAQTGESNSALVIGPRGVGKSALLECVLQELGYDSHLPRTEGVDCKHSPPPAPAPGAETTPSSSSECCVVVRLHGLMQTDDRLAIQQITKQLNLTTTVGARTFSSFSDNLSFLLTALRSGDRQSLKTVVFILDEFDLFCQHKNQTLLYNLFDVAQSAQTPVCVVGVTARLDVVELLEKRVKSRFSHRQLFLYGATSFADYTALALSYLQLLPAAGDGAAAAAAAENGGQQLVQGWNEHVSQLLQLAPVLACLRRLFHLSRDVRLLKTYLRMVLIECQLSAAKADDGGGNCDAASALNSSHFQLASQWLATDHRQNILLGVSVLELCLIIAMRHLTQIYDEPFNFEMVCREFGKFAAKNSTFASFSRPVLMKAFENLQALELVRPAVESASSGHACSRGLKEFQLFSVMVTQQQLTDTVRLMAAVPTEVTQWATTAVL